MNGGKRQPRGDRTIGAEHSETEKAVRWPSADAARGKAMTRDGGLQLQSYAWTGNNNGRFHSRVPGGVGGRRNSLFVGVVLQALSTTI